MSVVTSEGRPYSRFRKAIALGKPELVLNAAADLPTVALDDALAITLVLSADPSRYDRAAARWLGRLLVERPVRLGDAQLALGALGALRDGGREGAAEALIAICGAYSVGRGERVIEEWLDRQPAE